MLSSTRRHAQLLPAVLLGRIIIEICLNRNPTYIYQLKFLHFNTSVKASRPYWNPTLQNRTALQAGIRIRYALCGRMRCSRIARYQPSKTPSALPHPARPSVVWQRERSRPERHSAAAAASRRFGWPMCQHRLPHTTHAVIELLIEQDTACGRPSECFAVWLYRFCHIISYC